MSGEELYGDIRNKKNERSSKEEKGVVRKEKAR